MKFLNNFKIIKCILNLRTQNLKAYTERIKLTCVLNLKAV